MPRALSWQQPTEHRIVVEGAGEHLSGLRRISRPGRPYLKTSHARQRRPQPDSTGSPANQGPTPGLTLSRAVVRTHCGPSRPGGTGLPVPIPATDGRHFADGLVVMTYVEGKAPAVTELASSRGDRLTSLPAQWRRAGIQRAQPRREHPADQLRPRGEPGQPVPHRRVRPAQQPREWPVPSPPASPASAAQITATASARRSRQPTGTSTCITPQSGHRHRRGRNRQPIPFSPRITRGRACPIRPANYQRAAWHDWPPLPGPPSPLRPAHRCRGPGRRAGADHLGSPASDIVPPCSVPPPAPGEYPPDALNPGVAGHGGSPVISSAPGCRRTARRSPGRRRAGPPGSGWW